LRRPNPRRYFLFVLRSFFALRTTPMSPASTARS
jgi:hypothetical protein